MINCLVFMRQKVLGYAVFVVLTFAALFAVQPKPDVVTINFASLAGSFSGLLTALGGFSITVLAVLLGLDALDFEVDNGDPGAHGAAVRHVAVSLAVACITCFVGANLMAEVSAQCDAIEKSRASVTQELGLRLEAAGVSRSNIAAVQSVLSTSGTSKTFYPASNAESRVRSLLPGKARLDQEARDKAKEADDVFQASGRRLFVVGSLSAYLSSVVILQALSFLLRIRFPRTTAFTSLQNFAVIGITAVLMIKVVHSASYGLQNNAFYASRIALLVLMLTTGILTSWSSRKTVGRFKRSDKGLDTYTPLAPYYAVLGSTILCAMWLAATFSRYGPPTFADQAFVLTAVGVCTAMLLVIQLEQPTIELLVRSNGHRTPDQVV